jgi:hypothetical protein
MHFIFGSDHDHGSWVILWTATFHIIVNRESNQNARVHGCGGK